MAKENLTVGMIYAYEAGEREGARKAREEVLKDIRDWVLGGATPESVEGDYIQISGEREDGGMSLIQYLESLRGDRSGQEGGR